MIAFFVCFAGLFGAAGVAGAAVAAHGGGNAQLAATAAAIALVHAPSLLGLAAFVSRMPRLAPLSGLLIIVGTLLFSGDLAARIGWGERLFANAAPLGGTLLIAGWLFVAAAGVGLAMRRLTS
ncbi:DUF423 domain-containing protein [Aurantimonas litoralis]|nr:DUF423 domain-containing protein [Aurantimonas litoralis]